MSDTWPVDWPENVPDADPQQKELAEHYAAATLRMLTLGLVGGTLITVRPRVGCARPLRYLTHGGIECGCFGGCACPARSSVRLTPPVGRVEQVTINGAIVPENTYRLDGGMYLVRLNDHWPSCAEEVLVTYLNGTAVDPIGRHVAGLLAVEWLKAIVGDKSCRLPANVTGITRQGVSMDIATGLFPGGATGINAVDMYVRQFNPHGLKRLPTVSSPDYRPVNVHREW